MTANRTERVRRHYDRSAGSYDRIISWAEKALFGAAGSGSAHGRAGRFSRLRSARDETSPSTPKAYVSQA
jgi:hypothetical protein